MVKIWLKDDTGKTVRFVNVSFWSLLKAYSIISTAILLIYLILLIIGGIIAIIIGFSFFKSLPGLSGIPGLPS